MFAKSVIGKGTNVCSGDIVVLGDSFSDTGNLFSLSAGGLPPARAYNAGRFSNGQIWIEYLADLMELDQPRPRYDPKFNGTNYAIAGAATANGPSITWTPALLGGPLTLPARDLLLQTQDFLNDDQTLCASESLFVIWIGANDLALLGEGPNFNNIIMNIESSIMNLIGGGASEFIVLNLPQLADLPAGVGTYGSIFVNETLPSGLRMHVESFNAGLVDMLENIDASDECTTITHVNIAQLLEEAVLNPVKFGLDDQLDTGIPTFSETDWFLNGNTLTFQNAQNAVFYDTVHPTTTFHEAIAEEVHRVVTSTKSSKSGKSCKTSKGPKSSKITKAPKSSKAPKGSKAPKSSKTPKDVKSS